MGWKETHRGNKLLVIFCLMAWSGFPGSQCAIIMYNLHISSIYSPPCVNYIKKKTLINYADKEYRRDENSL